MSDCTSDLHKHEFPAHASYVQALTWPTPGSTLDGTTAKCPDCGGWGWEPPAAGHSTCRMCDTEIHYNAHWEEWRHNEADTYFCPGKTASIATPDESEDDDEQAR